MFQTNFFHHIIYHWNRDVLNVIPFDQALKYIYIRDEGLYKLTSHPALATDLGN